MARVIIEAMHHLDSNINNLNVISLADLNIIYHWNNKNLSLINACIHDVVQNQSLEQPAAVAVNSWDKDLIYAQLEEQALSLAFHLSSLRVKPREIVLFTFQKSV